MRFEDLRRGDGVGGSLYSWRGNCVIGAILGGGVWIVGRLVGDKCDWQLRRIGARSRKQAMNDTASAGGITCTKGIYSRG